MDSPLFSNPIYYCISRILPLYIKLFLNVMQKQWKYRSRSRNYAQRMKFATYRACIYA